ncbi:MAG: ATP-dependent sacrificial sulfur transferase LarE [Syntrophomonadaceae bacterium]
MPSRTGSYERLQSLENAIRALKRVIIAFSGGSDSAFLLWVCARILPADDLAAVTFLSATTPVSEIRRAISVAGSLSVRHVLLPGPEMQSESFLVNDLSRCYQCKRERFYFLRQKTDILPGAQMIEGSVADDLDDFRPGMQAIREAGVSSPLLEAGMSKVDIARIARDANLAFAPRPSESCLATRIDTGLAIDIPLLQKLGQAEQALHDMGFEQVRIRWGGEEARLEFMQSDLPRAREERFSIEEVLNRYGFKLISPVYSEYEIKGKRGDDNE